MYDHENEFIFKCYFCEYVSIINRNIQIEFKCFNCHTRFDKETKKVTERSLKEIESIKEMRKQGLIECPRCIKWIEKVEGCNHITCSCAHQFCYVCGKDWNKHNSCEGLVLYQINGHLTTD